MSHAEIWDDSALVDSWNEALEEYKQYHSISARGEKVEDVLKESETQTNGYGGGVDDEAEVAGGPLADDLHAKKDMPKETVDHAKKMKSRTDGEQQAATNQASGSTTSKGPDIPQHLIGQVDDEGLKNLLMAWYYAGYYTGLREGKKN